MYWSFYEMMDSLYINYAIDSFVKVTFSMLSIKGSAASTYSDLLSTTAAAANIVIVQI